MQEFNESENEFAPEFITAIDPIVAPEVAPKPSRGRPKKVVDNSINVKDEKAALAEELTAQKAFSKAQPFMKQWEVTVGKKIIRYTKAFNGNVYREFVGPAFPKKKRA